MKKGRVISLISLLIVLIIWKLSAFIINADIILPPPERVAMILLPLLSRKSLALIVGATIIRGLLGFLISFLAGGVIGVLAGIFKNFRSLLKPVLVIMRSTPVISVILLALIWFNTNSVPIFVSFLMAFPIICGTMIEGVTTVDKELLEMAKVYKVSFRKQLYKIYLPSLTPFIISSAGVSLGIIWKVVVAAEVLSQPNFGIGTSLNEAKAYLITEEVFAWTILAILLSYLTDKLFKSISNRVNWRNYGAK